MSDHEMKLPMLAVKDGMVVGNSRDIASYFGKEVRHVHQAIRNVYESEPEFACANFRPNEINDLTGTSVVSFDMTRAAFALVSMGFTGKKAMKFKIAYIERFDAMEAELRARDEEDDVLIIDHTPNIPNDQEMRFLSLALKAKGTKFGSALWDALGFYCPPGFEPPGQGSLFGPSPLMLR